MPEVPALEDFRREARAWLAANAERRPAEADLAWGQGPESVALFRNLSHDDERALIDAHRAWLQRRSDAGFGSLSWEAEWGGRDLPRAYDRAFAEEEAHFDTPPSHEAIGITRDLIAPTIRAVGTRPQQERFLHRMLRTEDLWCQLMSEPAAGSDVAGVATRAVRDGDEWVVDGQKVWTSGAQYADWGYLLCRTDPTVPKHKGLSVFLVDMRSPGVEVRPLRQMSGGSSFSEVFLSGVRIPADGLLGEPGEGWRVALTTLGFERNSSTGEGTGWVVRRLVALAQHLGRADDPVIRQLLARAHIRAWLLHLTGERVKASQRAGDTPGPEGSIGKLYWTETLRVVNEAAAAVLGPALGADTGEWGTYAWHEHLLGTAGYRIAGGADEIQRNILGERVLGLPGEPRPDRDAPFSPTAARG